MRRENVLNLNVCFEIFLFLNNQFHHHDWSMITLKWTTTTCFKWHKTTKNWRAWSYNSFSQFSFVSHQQREKNKFFMRNVKWVDELYNFWLDFFFKNRQIFNVNYIEINIDYFDFIFNLTHCQELQTLFVQIRFFRTIWNQVDEMF